jgi:hypothetical protein
MPERLSARPHIERSAHVRSRIKLSNVFAKAFCAAELQEAVLSDGERYRRWGKDDIADGHWTEDLRKTARV